MGISFKERPYPRNMNRRGLKHYKNVFPLPDYDIFEGRVKVGAIHSPSRISPEFYTVTVYKDENATILPCKFHTLELAKAMVLSSWAIIKANYEL